MNASAGTDPSSTGTATVLPGARYGHQLPLLLFAGRLLEERGFQVERVEWSDPEGGRKPALEDAAAALASVPSNTKHVVVGKSLGTLALPLAVKAGLPGVWLTPLCQEPEVASSIRAATAPTLLIGGTGDGSWDGDIARSGSAEVVELDGADHALALPDAVASVEYLQQVVRAMATFLDRI
jgi:pimeloyl-ACP methyl ester carboxylesterase